MTVLYINDLKIVADHHEYQTLPVEQQILLIDYVNHSIKPYATVKTINRELSSYILKHKAEKYLRFTISHLDLKVAMARCGIDGVAYKHSVTMYYPLSKKIKEVLGTG